MLEEIRLRERRTDQVFRILSKRTNVMSGVRRIMKERLFSEENRISGD